MKTHVINGKIILTVESSDNNEKEIELSFPIHNAYYWYPLNINYTYKYSKARDMLYLTREKDAAGEDVYEVTPLKKTKPLDKCGGVIFNPKVFSRNRQIMAFAQHLDVPTLYSNNVTKHDVEEGFQIISEEMKIVKEEIEYTYITNSPDVWFAPDNPTEEWDAEVFKYATDEQVELMQDLGEIYCMLNLLRKIVEDKE